MTEREPTFECGMCGCCGEFMDPWDLCEHCSRAPGVNEFLRRAREKRLGRLYKAQLGPHPKDWSYVLAVGRVGDNVICQRVSLMLDETSVLRVHATHLAELPTLDPEADFNDAD